MFNRVAIASYYASVLVVWPGRRPGPWPGAEAVTRDCSSHKNLENSSSNFKLKFTLIYNQDDSKKTNDSSVCVDKREAASSFCPFAPVELKLLLKSFESMLFF